MIALLPAYLTKAYVRGHLRTLADGRAIQVHPYHTKTAAASREDTKTRDIFADIPPAENQHRPPYPPGPHHHAREPAGGAGPARLAAGDRRRPAGRQRPRRASLVRGHRQPQPPGHEPDALAPAHRTGYRINPTRPILTPPNARTAQ